jgi:hypothetical protein
MYRLMQSLRLPHFEKEEVANGVNFETSKVYHFCVA